MQIKNSSNINSQDIETVEDFAKETGDKNTLSIVDKLVIAFGLTLSREKAEYDQVIKTPQKLEEFRPKSFKPYYENDDNQDSSDEDDVQPKAKADDGWTTTGTSKKVDNTPFDDFQETSSKNKRRADIKNHEFAKYQGKIEKQMEILGIEEVKTEKEQEPEEDMAVVAKSESSEFDDEEEGGKWITEANLYSNIGGAAGNLLLNNDNALFE